MNPQLPRNGSQSESDLLWFIKVVLILIAVATALILHWR